jgi:hypothetical protein
MYPASNPRSIDEPPRFSSKFNQFVDGVAGGSCKLIDYNPFLTGRFVEEA